VGERAAEGAAFEAEGFKEGREFVVVLNEPAGDDAGSGLDACVREERVCAHYFLADVFKSSIGFVFGNVMRVDGHEDAAESGIDEGAHVFSVQSPPLVQTMGWIPRSAA
tara:strand:+ start:4423 stop:4749 length:327 start_codon:yes stop_codon:yes gene_type:complete